VGVGVGKCENSGAGNVVATYALDIENVGGLIGTQGEGNDGSSGQKKVKGGPLRKGVVGRNITLDRDRRKEIGGA